MADISQKGTSSEQSKGEGQEGIEGLGKGLGDSSVSFGEQQRELIENKVKEIMPTLSGLSYSVIEQVVEDVLRIAKLYPLLITHP